MIPLLANGGDLTILRALATHSFGKWAVTWPESVPENQRPNPGKGREFGYIADLNHPAGRLGRRFARADIAIAAAEYYDGNIIPHTGASNVEKTIDECATRSAGDTTLDREITREGLGAYLPGVDFSAGDIVPVEIWGRILHLQVQRTEKDRVQVGNSIMANLAAAGDKTEELRRALVAERRERLKTGDAITQTANAARADALDAKAAAARAVTKTEFEYAPATDRLTAPSSGWSLAYPADATIIWQRPITHYGDGRTERGTATVITGATGPQGPKGSKGDTGRDGIPGRDGTRLTSTTVTYAASTSGTTAPSSGWQNQPPTAAPGQFVWTKLTITYSDGTTEDAYTVGKIGNTGATGPQGPKGSKGDTGRDGIPGKDGTRLTSTTVTYAASTSGTNAPSQGWQSQPPTAAPGQFVWTRFVWKYSDGTSETGYSVGKIGDTGPRGPQGPKGNTGAQGLRGPQGESVHQVIKLWRWAASKPATPTGANISGWATTQPAYQVGTTLWTTTLTIFSTGRRDYTPVTEEASVSAATAIAAESANNKNRVFYSATGAGSTRGEREGDTWFQYSGTTIVGQWRWTGSSWAPQTIGNQVIANLDAGKITSGIIDARRIAAGSIDATKIKADSISVREINAEALIPQGTSLIAWEVPKPGAAPVPIWWNQGTPQTVGGGDSKHWFHPGGENIFMFTRKTTSPPRRLMKVKPGRIYQLRFWAWAAKPGSRLYIEMRDQNGRHAVRSGTVGPGPGNTYNGVDHNHIWNGRHEQHNAGQGDKYLVNNWEVPTEPTLVESDITFNSDVEYAYLSNFYWNHNGTVTTQYFTGLTLDLDESTQQEINKANSALQSAAMDLMEAQQAYSAKILTAAVDYTDSRAPRQWFFKNTDKKARDPDPGLYRGVTITMHEPYYSTYYRNVDYITVRAPKSAEVDQITAVTVGKNATVKLFRYGASDLLGGANIRLGGQYIESCIITVTYVAASVLPKVSREQHALAAARAEFERKAADLSVLTSRHL